ncbi:hypothetical protein OEZ86_008023 [Tetradesmus obliquus]|uniref:Uncharacterized protein n=2 Tax=Tetradesmus obliquus TaxID=3088 RepID=A0ABY8U820_TETOB|nr:hypothetical protein OEZ85_013233 [Tetradesmus obliquus]WIA36754.1 hypothetical protein OEZ86_008023 [Tetradesmus obliquus]|eukprot:jgi/Sobl393_1/9432/SZX66031.1
MALSRLVAPFMDWAATRYQARLASNLKKYGLRYDDLYDPMMDLDVAEALRRLPEDVIVARNARLKRAMDLSLKGTFLPEELQAQQTPFQHYMQDLLNEIKSERQERAQLGGFAPYQRTIP